MKTPRIGLLLALFALTSSVAFAADIEGKWTAEVQGRGGPVEVVFKKAS